MILKDISLSEGFVAAVVLETDGDFSVIADGRAADYSALAPMLSDSERKE
tara:strand:+ start:3182 stop:3331 length:150 start_codon:yes stop_codon:yes gene_type:complete